MAYLSCTFRVEGLSAAFGQLLSFTLLDLPLNLRLVRKIQLYVGVMGSQVSFRMICRLVCLVVHWLRGRDRRRRSVQLWERVAFQVLLGIIGNVSHKLCDSAIGVLRLTEATINIMTAIFC